MKNILLTLLIGICISANAQTPQNQPTQFTTWLGVPYKDVPTTIAGKPGFNYYPTADKLAYYKIGTSTWRYLLDEITAAALYAPIGSTGTTNLGLGTRTSTIVPITSSTGTGVDIPVATGSLAGMESAADKTKLDGITGTNTGDQTVSVGTTPGNIVLSGTGGNATIRSIASDGGTGFPNAATAPAARGLYPYITSTGTTGYPADNGNGIWLFRNASTLLGSFGIWKSSSATDQLYYVTGSGASTLNNFHIFADRDWASPQVSPTFTGTVVLPSTTSIGTVSSTEIGYLDNVTSAIQTQINAKGSGTVTSFGKTDGYGITSSVANSTTTPVHTISADTASATAIVSKSRLASNLGGYVTLATDQTLSGRKKFTSTLVLDSGSVYLKPITIVPAQPTGWHSFSAVANGFIYRANSISQALSFTIPSGGTGATWQTGSGTVAWTSDVTGAEVKPIRAITGATTILTTDYTVYATSGTFNQPMPTTTLATGQIINITNIGAGTVTVTATSMSGQTSIGLSSGSSLQLQYTGTSGTYIIL